MFDRIISPIRSKFPGIQWIDIDNFKVQPPTAPVNYELVSSNVQNDALIVYTSGTTGKPKVRELSTTLSTRTELDGACAI